jgi:hypothetical protein
MAAAISGVKWLNVLILIVEDTVPMPGEIRVMRNVCSIQRQQRIYK